MTTFTTTPAFFEAKYRQNQDPWNFATSPAELQRYEIIIAALKDRRYGFAFEPGCSIGVLTERLARLCGRVLAIDLSASAIAAAQVRCASLGNVELRVASLLDPLPAQPVDLLVLCEIGYYFTTADWAALLNRLLGRVPDGGTVLAAHWLGESADHLVHGDEVHCVLRQHRRLELEREERHSSFRLDRFRVHTRDDAAPIGAGG